MTIFALEKIGREKCKMKAWFKKKVSFRYILLHHNKFSLFINKLRKRNLLKNVKHQCSKLKHSTLYLINRNLVFLYIYANLLYFLFRIQTFNSINSVILISYTMKLLVILYFNSIMFKFLKSSLLPVFCCCCCWCRDSYVIQCLWIWNNDLYPISQN